MKLRYSLLATFACLLHPVLALAVWQPDGNALSMAIGPQLEPEIVSDGAGGAIVAWVDHRSGTDTNIYAQRIDPSGTVQCATDGIAVCTATGNQSSPTIVSDGSDGVIVIWQDARTSPWDIYAQRVNVSGGVQWTADGVAVCTSPNSQSSLNILSDGTGRAIVA